jgi:hypothetical protein
VFLNNNLWLATAFALTILAAVVGLLFFLAWIEPASGARRRTVSLLPRPGALIEDDPADVVVQVADVAG